MDLDLKDKTVAVTGGAEGIGYSIADHFLSEGANVVLILDVNKTKGEEATAKLNLKHGKGKVVFYEWDVTDYKTYKKISAQIVAEHKYLDVLVNNAGILDESDIRRTMEVNAIAPILWTYKCWKLMRKDRGKPGATIINIGSVHSYAVDPYLPVYKASKFAVMGYSRSLGHTSNYEKFGVRVLILCPGMTRTSLVEKMQCWEEHSEDVVNNAMVWQTADCVGRAAIKIYKEAESGTAWKIIGGKLDEIPLVEEGDHNPYF